MDFQQSLEDTEEGFTKQLCTGRLLQDSLAPNCSLLAASQATGMLLVGASDAEQNAVLVFTNASALITTLTNSEGREGACELRQHASLMLPLPAPCQALHWSHDSALAAVLTVQGDIFIYAAQQLAARSAEYTVHLRCRPVRQVAWSPLPGRLLVLTANLQLHSADVTTSAPALQLLRQDVCAVACTHHLVAMATVSDAQPAVTIAMLPSPAKVTELFTEPLPYELEDAAALIDSLAFIAPDTLVLNVLSVSVSSPDVAANEDNEMALLELDDAEHPSCVTYAAQSELRFHALAEQVRKPGSDDAYLQERAPTQGPYMHAAVFAAPFCAAIIASGERGEDHIVHLVRNTSDSDVDSHWQEVANPLDALKFKVPNTEGASEDELYVPNFVAGATAVVTHAGEVVHHPSSEGPEPAQVRMMHLLSAWCNLSASAVRYGLRVVQTCWSCVARADLHVHVDQVKSGSTVASQSHYCRVLQGLC